MGSHSLLQGISPTQGWKPGLQHRGQTLYRLTTREAHFLQAPENPPCPPLCSCWCLPLGALDFLNDVPASQPCGLWTGSRPSTHLTGSPRGRLWADTGAGLPVLRLQTRSLCSDLDSWVGCVPEAGIRSSDFYLFPLGPRGRTEHKKMELESWLEAGSRNLLGRLLQGLSAPTEPGGPEGLKHMVLDPWSSKPSGFPSPEPMRAEATGLSQPYVGAATTPRGLITIKSVSSPASGQPLLHCPHLQG